MKLSNQKEYYTINEAKELLNISRLTIYRYIKSGYLNSNRVGWKYRIKKDDLEEFIKIK